MQRQPSLTFTKSFVASSTREDPFPSAPIVNTTNRLQHQFTKGNYEQSQHVLQRHYSAEAEQVTAEYLDSCKRMFAAVQQVSKYVTNQQQQELLHVSPAGLVGLVLNANSMTASGADFSDTNNVDRVLRNALRIATDVLKDSLFEDYSRVPSLRQISSQSFIHSDELVYVHLWHSRREARKFQANLRALSVSRHRLALPNLLCVPLSVALAFQGRMVTVTWLAPLLDEAPIQCTNDGVLGAMDDAWRFACGGSIVGAQRLQFHAGADGRYYCVAPTVLAGLGDRNMESSNVCRHEHMTQDRGGAEDDYRAVELHIESALTRAAVQLGDIVTNEERLREASPDLITKICRECGLNKQFLFRLRNVLVQTLQNGDQAAAAAAVVDLIDTEMIGRTLKTVMEAHILLAVDESEGPLSLASRLLIMNELMTMFFRHPEFLQNTLMPIMRVKYRATEAFVVHPSHLKLGMIARLLAERFAMSFDPKHRRFAAFLEEPVVLGHTARSAISSAEYLVGNKVLASRKVQDFLKQSIAVRLKQLEAPTGFSFAPKLGPALFALSTTLIATTENYASVAAGCDKELISSSSSKAELARTSMRQFYAGMALYFGIRAQYLSADLASDTVVVENMIQREGNGLGHALQGAASRMTMMDVHYVLLRLLDCLRTSPEAVGMQSDAWTHILLSCIERVAGSSLPPISRDYEKALEIKTLLRRALLLYFSEVPSSGRELVKRLPDAIIARLASSFPKERLMPSLLLVAQCSYFILQDELTSNVEKLDQNDCTVLLKIWDELIGQSIPMWLLVGDGCQTDLQFEETLGRLLTDDEALTLLQFVVMVANVGHVQKILATENKQIVVDRRKQVVSTFSTLFRTQLGQFQLEAKLEKVTEEIDRLINPLEEL